MQHNTVFAIAKAIQYVCLCRSRIIKQLQHLIRWARQYNRVEILPTKRIMQLRTALASPHQQWLRIEMNRASELFFECFDVAR